MRELLFCSGSASLWLGQTPVSISVDNNCGIFKPSTVISVVQGDEIELKIASLLARGTAAWAG